MKKKTISLSRALSLLSIVMTLLLIMLTGFIAGYVFKRIVSDIYNKSNKSITGSALAGMTTEQTIAYQKLMLEVDSVIRAKADPVKEAEEDREAYLASFKKIGSSGSYRHLWNLLNTVRKKTESTSLDFVLMYPEKNIEVFIIDASDANILPCGELHVIDTDLYKDFEKKDFDPISTVSPVYGSLMTGGSVFYVNKQLGMYAFLLSDIPIQEVIVRLRYFLLNVLLVTLVGLIVIGILFSHNIRGGVTDPLDKIINTAKRFVEHYEIRSTGKEGGASFGSIDGGKITELNELVDSLQSMEQEMNVYLQELHQMTSERTRIETELDLAKRIQMSMMPDDFSIPSAEGRVDLFASMIPAKEVGGDFYDFFMIDEDHLCLVIADVSGKGVPAALFMMTCKTMLKNDAIVGEPDPAGILEELNEQISRGNRENMFVTIWLGILDLRDGTVKAVNAGHEYPIVKKPESGFELLKDRHGILVGFQPGTRYHTYEFKLEPGGGIFLYTDGLTEASAGKRRMFGMDRVIRGLNDMKDEPAANVIGHINLLVQNFVGEELQFDDLTLMCLIYQGPDGKDDKQET